MAKGGASAQAGEARLRAPGDAGSVFTEIVRGRDQFLKLRTEWDSALTASEDPSPALEHDFLRLWLETFAASQTPWVVAARQSNRLSAALGLLVGRSIIDGVPVLLAQGWTNAHSMRGGLLLGPGGSSAIRGLVHRALSEPWDVLMLRDVPREPAGLDTLGDALRAEGCSVAFESPMESPYVPLPTDWAELERRLDARFRQNLRRRRRRLEEHGKVRVDIISGPDGLDAALEDAFTIEASGWKGREGSAIRAHPEQVSFYSTWARRLAKDGRLRLCFLAVGDRRVAFQFGFVRGARYYLPKCAFEETYQECSPGQLLMVDVVQHCIAERLESFEFLGFNMPWKRDWTPLVRPHATLLAFRPTLPGRLAGVIRASIRPAIARAVHEIQGRLGKKGST